MGKIKFTEESQGERPFRCPMCRKLLLLDVQGEYRMLLQCVRCKTKITLETTATISAALAVRAGALLTQ